MSKIVKESDATACFICKGKCCKKLPEKTAEDFVQEVSSVNPELLQFMTTPVAVSDKGIVVCPFLSTEKDEGCLLETQDRPYRCKEFECDLFQIVAQDPGMIEDCKLYATVLMANPCSGNYKILCGANCPRKNNCIIPRENRSNLSK